MKNSKIKLTMNKSRLNKIKRMKAKIRTKIQVLMVKIITKKKHLTDKIFNYKIV